MGAPILLSAERLDRHPWRPASVPVFVFAIVFFSPNASAHPLALRDPPAPDGWSALFGACVRPFFVSTTPTSRRHHGSPGRRPYRRHPCRQRDPSVRRPRPLRGPSAGLMVRHGPPVAMPSRRHRHRSVSAVFSDFFHSPEPCIAGRHQKPSRDHGTFGHGVLHGVEAVIVPMSSHFSQVTFDAAVSRCQQDYNQLNGPGAIATESRVYGKGAI